MNKTQLLYIGASKAAFDIDKTAGEHAQETERLEAFNQQGHDKADYSFWHQIYNEQRGRLAGFASAKAKSELAAAKPAA